MKKEQREIYLDILRIGGLGLCNACKFAGFSGSWCCAELECEHPLPAINGNGIGQDPWDVWNGSDCWGFRPSKGYTLSDIATMASICHDGNIPIFATMETYPSMTTTANG